MRPGADTARRPDPEHGDCPLSCPCFQITPVDGMSLKTEWHIEHVPLSLGMFNEFDASGIIEMKDGVLGDVEGECTDDRGKPNAGEVMPAEESGRQVMKKTDLPLKLECGWGH